MRLRHHLRSAYMMLEKSSVHNLSALPLTGAQRGSAVRLPKLAGERAIKAHSEAILPCSILRAADKRQGPSIRS